MSNQHFCPTCDFKTSSQRRLTTHERITHGEYKCHFCDDKFNRSDYRYRHEKYKHTGVKDYICNHCNEKFVTSGDRDRHEKHKHTFIKDYNYRNCDMNFVTSSDRDRHEKYKHTGVKDHKCNHCNEKFVTSYEKNRHENYKHIWPFCIICLKIRVDPKRNNISCGFCSRLITYGSKQRTIFEYLFDCYDERLHEPFWTLLDQQMSCGVNRRPDGLMEFKTLQGNVKFILEVDEFEHDRNTPACEIARLHEIQERDSDALYVLRYNPDSEDGLKNYMLDELADRIIDIIETDYKKSFDSPTLINVEYIGYDDERINNLTRIEIGLQEATLNFFNTLIESDITKSMPSTLPSE
jgi:hypothetical protein